ncbi:MAG TPA: hypothetical protein VHA56_16295 [Mucilaginibacter sp.]|nr:hypothetical protein [Mucilaginibacter sp.]
MRNNHRTIAPHPDTELPRINADDFFKGRVWRYRSSSQPRNRYEKIGHRKYIVPLDGYDKAPIPIAEVKAKGVIIQLPGGVKYIDFSECILSE